jgi:hypothetical protein
MLHDPLIKSLTEQKLVEGIAVLKRLIWKSTSESTTTTEGRKAVRVPNLEAKEIILWSYLNLTFLPVHLRVISPTVLRYPAPNNHGVRTEWYLVLHARSISLLQRAIKRGAHMLNYVPLCILTGIRRELNCLQSCWFSFCNGAVCDCV